MGDDPYPVIAIGDLNGDIYMDLATNNVSVFLSNGDGSFQDAINFAVFILFKSSE